MNDAVLGMVVKALGLKPEDVRGLVGSLANGKKDIEDIKVLLQDNLEVNKAILVELKKRGVK